jgi:hypothetical protein
MKSAASLVQTADCDCEIKQGPTIPAGMLYKVKNINKVTPQLGRKCEVQQNLVSRLEVSRFRALHISSKILISRLEHKAMGSRTMKLNITVLI